MVSLCRVKHSQLLRPCSSKHSAWHLTPLLSSECASTVAGGNLNPASVLWPAHWLPSCSCLVVLSCSLDYHIQVPISWRLKGPPGHLCVCLCVCVFVCVCISPICVYAFLSCLCSSLCPVFCLQILPPVPLDSPRLLTQGDCCVLKYSCCSSSELGKSCGSPCCSLSHGDHLSVLSFLCAL